MPQFGSAVAQEPQVQLDSDGLPIPPGKAELDSEGLPIPPGLKKKEESGGFRSGPQNLPSAISSTTTPMVAPAAASVSKSDLHQNIFGITEVTPPKISSGAVSSKDRQKIHQEQITKEFKEAGEHPELFADDKGSLITQATNAALEKAKSDQERQSINIRKHDLSDKYRNGKLTGDDIEYLRAGAAPEIKEFTEGLTPDTIAKAINTKADNLRAWANINVMKGIGNAQMQMGMIDNQLKELKGIAHFGQSDDKIKTLEAQKNFLQHSITQVYNAEIDKDLPNILSDLTNAAHPGKNIKEVVKDSYKKEPSKESEFGPLGLMTEKETTEKKPDYFIEYDPKTDMLTKESTQSVLKFADEWGKKNNNAVLKAGQFGGVIPEGASYNEIGRRLVEQLNMQSVDHNIKSATEDFKNKNKSISPLIDHQDKLSSYFSKENNDAADAYAGGYFDKNSVIINEKYSGILATNPELIKIHHKYADAVGRNEMTPEVAKKQIDAELENNPVLKKIGKQYDAEVEAVREKARQMRADYLTNGLQQSVDENVIVYKDGSLGVKGMSQKEVYSKLKELDDIKTKAAANTLHKQNDAMNLNANERAERQGPLIGSLIQASKEMGSAFTKWFFDKTKWGGDAARMFQAENLTEIPTTESEVAKKAWNWKGAESLLNWKFYASQIGSMIPIMAPSAAMTMLTEGAGAPEAINWMAAAGIFTFQDGLSFSNRLQNTTDKYGNKLTDYDIGKASEEQMREEFLPNLFGMSLNLGTLSRANAIAKPSLGRALKESIAGATLGAVPMQAQGYLSYVNSLKAQGKDADFWDYTQDNSIMASMVGMTIGGLGLQSLHLPINYVKQIKNWKYMVASSTGEFHANSMYNIALQHQARGMGNYFEDAAKLHLFNNWAKTPEEKANLENLLQYSHALDKNIKSGNLNPQNLHDLYQAHNLALADHYDAMSEKNADNKNLSAIYKDQAKGYREQAKSVMEGKAKFHYLMDGNNEPIFLSDNSFKHLDANGNIKDWLEEGVIKGVHNSEDPNFDSEYKKGLQEKEEEQPRRPPLTPKFKEGDVEKIVEAVHKFRGDLNSYGKMTIDPFLDDTAKHQEIAETIISQAADPYSQKTLKEMIGKNAFNEIKPIIDEQIDLAKPKVEDLPKLREPEEAKGILKTAEKIVSGDFKIRDAEDKIDREATRKISERADEISEIKKKHDALEELIKNCL